jgi:hypothetical protein
MYPLAWITLKHCVKAPLTSLYDLEIRTLSPYTPHQPATMDPCVNQHFRFLDLPIELRLMVYENLSFTTRTVYHTYYDKDIATEEEKPVTEPSAAVMRKCFSTAILATCKQIHSEAKTTISKSLRLLKLEPTRLFMDIGAFSIFIHNAPKAVEIMSSLFGRYRTERSSPVEVILTKADQEPQIHGVVSALMFLRSYPPRPISSCTVFYQGVLPTLRVSSRTTRPGRSFWNSCLQFDTSDSLRHVVLNEVGDGEWVELSAKWAQWPHSTGKP